ncbi:15359_t:CDS:2, partial [Racocetra persica]
QNWNNCKTAKASLTLGSGLSSINVEGAYSIPLCFMLLFAELIPLDGIKESNIILSISSSVSLNSSDP